MLVRGSPTNHGDVTTYTARCQLDFHTSQNYSSTLSFVSANASSEIAPYLDTSRTANLQPTETGRDFGAVIDARMRPTSPYDIRLSGGGRDIENAHHPPIRHRDNHHLSSTSSPLRSKQSLLDEMEYRSSWSLLFDIERRLLRLLG